MSVNIKKVTSTVEVETYTCDFCDVELSSKTPRPQSCIVCGRHSCLEHGLFDPNDSGDYPARYCCTCWKAGQPFRATIANVRQESDDQIEEQQKRWYAAAKLQTAAHCAAERMTNDKERTNPHD